MPQKSAAAVLAADCSRSRAVERRLAAIRQTSEIIIDLIATRTRKLGSGLMTDSRVR